jgi:hypothetical protein
MQRIITAIYAIVILTGCVSSSQYLKPVQLKIDDIGLKYAKDEVQIAFGESYQNDEVELSVNGKRLFSKTISTPDDGTGLTDSVKFSRTKQHLDLLLFINGAQWKSRLNLNKGHFFCIMQIDDKPRIEQYRFPHYYD